ncbi:MAG: hypothetical protein EBY20_00820 [Alphaproteobacteria bacterium]|nr:hypothetical protein [Alphaproteobacteria bacterium]
MLLINILIYGLGAHLFLSSVCPIKYHITLINLSFYLILTYSYVELYAKKAYYHPNMSLIREFIENSKKQREIEIIKFNDVIASTNKENIHIHQLLLYDFIVFSDYDGAKELSQKVNKVLYFGFDNFPFTYSYNVCKFSFISFSVKLLVDGQEKSYPIKLSNDSENYYVIGNKINKLLVSYLLKKQHGVMRDELTETYVLEFIDQNVNMLSLSEKSEIVLNENDYKIVPFFYVDSSNMTVREVEKLCMCNQPIDSSADSKTTNNTSESMPE